MIGYTVRFTPSAAEAALGLYLVDPRLPEWVLASVDAFYPPDGTDRAPAHGTFNEEIPGHPTWRLLTFSIEDTRTGIEIVVDTARGSEITVGVVVLRGARANGVGRLLARGAQAWSNITRRIVVPLGPLGKAAADGLAAARSADRIKHRDDRDDDFVIFEVERPRARIRAATPGDATIAIDVQTQPFTDAFIYGALATWRRHRPTVTRIVGTSAAMPPPTARVSPPPPRTPRPHGFQPF